MQEVSTQSVEPSAIHSLDGSQPVDPHLVQLLIYSAQVALAAPLEEIAE